MGKNKKRFIDKDATKFVVLHRSQQDADYGKEGVSDFVLYPASGGTRPAGGAAQARQDLPFAGQKDHVNSLGLPNDGYDYNQHMRDIGGGRFVASNGSVLDKAPVLPTEALPSEEPENARQLEAITISEDLMDADVRAAMFDPSYEAEELEDDFVLQASRAAPEGEEAEQFDYDAHIARLIAASERHVFVADSDEEEDEYYPDEGTDHELGRRGDVESDFLKVLDQYDSDECGAPEEEDEEDEEDRVGLESTELEGILDEFLDEQVRSKLLISPQAADPTERPAADPTPSEHHPESEPEGSDHERADSISGLEASDMAAEFGPGYLVPKPEPQWDCETVLSTYSNLDNHPSTLKEPARRRGRQRGKAAAAAAQEAASSSPAGPARILLSEKTGLPVGVLGSVSRTTAADAEGPSEVRDNLGAARQKTESKEEKQARKQRIKAERRDRRIAKGEAKALHKESELRAAQHASRSSGGVSVFKYN
mmetsp:Transcript_4290/g.12743  ORF Transcript_4290/g.12743 Transcript_4290/m.12743 type:complete len:482 (-) Transcript_4290:168-1613(-)